MTQKMTQKKLEKIIATHSKKWNSMRNEGLGKSLFPILENLENRTHDEKDVVVSLYFANHKIQGQINHALKMIQDEKDDHQRMVLINRLLDLQTTNIHILQVLLSFHATESFEALYKKNQFYNSVNRFVRKDTEVPEGYYFVFTHKKDENNYQQVMVQTDQTVLLGELFDALYFGLFMQKPNSKEEKEQKVKEMLQKVFVDIISDQQMKKVTSNKDVQLIHATKVIESYGKVAQANLAVE